MWPIRQTRMEPEYTETTASIARFSAIVVSATLLTTAKSATAAIASSFIHGTVSRNMANLAACKVRLAR